MTWTFRQRFQDESDGAPVGARQGIDVWLRGRRSAVLELSQTKSDLIAMLAHDFRGPLTSIVGYAVANAMNMGFPLAVYATLCRETGAPGEARKGRRQAG